MNMKKILFGTTSDANIGLLILRVFIGAALLTHGYGKMFGGLPEFTKMVAGMGIPAPQVMAFLAAFTESFGALLLVLGLFTRPVAFMIVCNMGVAALVALGGKPFAQQELAWLYFVPALMFLLKGAGKWSLDNLLTRK